MQSRYYDPVVGRFINADEPTYLYANSISANLYSYCYNDPINRRDPSGQEAIDITSRLNSFMISATMQLYNYCRSLLFFKLFGSNMYIALVLKYFYEKVKAGGDWDIKSQESWHLTCENAYIYGILSLRYDDPGNIAFGFYGSLIFPIEILRAGAGLYQIYTRKSNIIWFSSFFDDPEDGQMIVIGHNLFLKYYNTGILPMKMPTLTYYYV